MSVLDDKNKFFDNLLKEFERDYKAFSSQLRKSLFPFLEKGVYTRAEIASVFAGSGYMDMVNGFVDKYDEVIQYGKRLSEVVGLPFVLPESSLSLFALIKDNSLNKLATVKSSILNTMTEASIRYGIGEMSFKNMTEFLAGTIDVAGRRVMTEAFTGASMYDRAINYENFQQSGIERYVYVGPLDDKTRTECIATLTDPRNSTGWTIAEIQSSQVSFIGGGGYNCRHDFLPMVEGAEDLIADMAAKAGIK